MALIKCVECGKEISDKASACPNCGCPVEKKNICIECGNEIRENDKICKNCGCPTINGIIEEKKNASNPILTKIWLVICALTCLFISAINFMNIFNILNSFFNIGSIVLNVMGILSLLLGGAYVFLFITSSKKGFYILLGINALILIYNLLNIGMITSVAYIILVLINSLITFLVMRKQLKKEKLKIKHYIPLFITLILAIALTFITSDNQNNYYDFDTNIGNERDSSVAQIEIITEYINIRSNKSVNSTIIGQVHYGEIYTIISEDENSSYNWYEIETADGRRGFIVGINNNTDYVKELEVIRVDVEEDKKEEPTTTPNTNSNNTSNNNNNSNSNNSNYTPTPTPAPTPTPEPQPINYNITSIEGIGENYKTIGYTTICRVDSFTANISESIGGGFLELKYSFKTTMIKQGNLNYCQFRIKIYDSNNIVIGATVPTSNTISEGESSAKSDSYLIRKEDITSTDFHIKMEDK